MTASAKAALSRRRRIVRRSPNIDALETRLVLSDAALGRLFPPADVAADGPSIVAVRPVERSPGVADRIEILFDTPIDPYSLGLADFQVEALDDEGATQAVVGPDTGVDESLDPSGTTLIITLPGPLADGRYRVDLTPYSAIGDLSGRPLPPVDADTPLAEFRLEAAGVTRDGAIDLGAAGPRVRDVAGRLDLAADPFAVQLYRIELTPDHTFWRLGLEVSAQRDGSPLDSALTLLNAAGRPIAAADLGRRDAPADPFLFAGLRPGIYYVGVTGGGNLGDRPGGYDIVRGTRGSSPARGPGGPFTLHVVADPAETPPALVGFRLDRDDPLSTDPTGFTLRFSAPMRLADPRRAMPEAADGGVRLVDASGREWPIAAIEQSETDLSLRYVLRSPLPPGLYRVRLADYAPLTDLAGLRPTAPGRASGLLADFSVLANPDRNLRPSSDPDLGALYPDTVLGSVATDVTIPAGGTVAIRFVTLVDDLYRISVTTDGASLDAQVTSERRSIAPNAQSTFRLGGIPLVHLTRGVHHLILSSSVDVPTIAHIRFTIPAFRWESLLLNGVGQGPALGLRLLTGDAPFPTTRAPGATAPTPIAAGVGETYPGTFPAAISAGVTIGQITTPAAAPVDVPSAPATTGSPAGMYVTLGGTPVGSFAVSTGNPSAQLTSGPASDNAATATPPAQPLARDVASFAPRGDAPVPTVLAPTEAPIDGGLALLASPDGDAGALAVDAESLTESERSLATTGDDTLLAAGTTSEAEDATRALPEGLRLIAPLEASSGADPGFGFGLLAAVVIHYRRRIRAAVEGLRRRSRPARPAPHLPRRSLPRHSGESLLGGLH